MKADLFKKYIDNGLHEHLPGLLPPIVQDLLPPIVQDILQYILPDILRAILPGILAASPSSSPSPSQVEVEELCRKPKVKGIVSAAVKTHLESVAEDAVDAAAQAAASLAVVMAEETLEEHRVDLYTIREEAVAEMERMKDKHVDAFREDVEGVAEDVAEQVGTHAEGVVDRACGLLDEIGSEWVGDLLSRLIEEAHTKLAKEQATQARERSITAGGDVAQSDL